MAESFESLLGALGRKLDGDPELRRLMAATLARLVCEAGGEETPSFRGNEGAPAAEQASAVELPAPLPAAERPGPPQLPRATERDLRSLLETFGARPAAEVPSPPSREDRPAPVPPDLGPLMRRLALKRDTVRSARGRAAEVARGVDVPPRWEWFSPFIDRARQLDDCFLWMVQSEHEGVAEREWHTLEFCYTAALQALDLANEVFSHGDLHGELPDVLHLLAEAQSALRIQCLALQTTDLDQQEIFGLLREVGHARAIYIRRWMRLDDPADPAAATHLLERLDEAAGHLASKRQTDALVKRGLNRIRYEFQRMTEESGEAVDRWRKIYGQLEELLEAGVPATDSRLQKLVSPHRSRVPAAEVVPASPMVQSVFIGDRLAVAVEDDEEDDEEEKQDEDGRSFNPAVRLVRDWVAGGDLVLIGGDRRPAAAQALSEAFGLSELNWITTRPHESPALFEPAIARANVRAVLLAIRWSSHSYGDVRQYCEKYCRPLVRLPAGYGVNQVAVQIAEQLRLQV